jgi:hypothetical protein
MEWSNPASAECPACSMLLNEARVKSRQMRTREAYYFVCNTFVSQVDRTCADLLQQQCIVSFVSSCPKSCSHVRAPCFILRPLSSCNLWQHAVALAVVLNDSTTVHLQVYSFVRFHVVHTLLSCTRSRRRGTRRLQANPPSPSIHESLESFLM